MNLDDRVGNPTYSTRTYRQFLNDLWAIRDNLTGDPKAVKLPGTSPLGRLLAVPAALAAIDKWLRAQPTTHPVTLTPADRAAIVAEISEAIIAALPEYGPRRNTP